MLANSQNQKTIKFAQNSSAQNDSFTNLPGNADHFVLDVLANDRGGRAKVLWSLDEGSEQGNEPTDLLTRDDSTSKDYSELGAEISITQDGKVSYVITPALQSKLNNLSVGETLTDTFIYAMKTGQGNSPLNWAKVTVTLNGLNHAPELTGTTAILPEGIQNTSYTILTSDLLQGFTDADHDALSVANLTATHGALKQTADGWIFTPENNFTGEVELDYDIVDGHGGSSGATLKFTLASDLSNEVAPTLTSSEPADDSSAVPVNNNIVLHFDEPVAPGTGNIVITNGTDTRLIAANDGSQVTFSDSKVTINPTTNLVPNTTYHVEMANGVITDTSGNPYAGIHDSSTLNFTTIPDTNAPLLTWSNPFDDGTFKIDSDMFLAFNEEIVAGSGNIIITNGTDTRTIAIDDPSQVTISNSKNGGTLIINPSADLVLNSNYHIEIADGAITDTSGNAWSGISDDTTLNFTTINSNPLLAGSNPVDDGVDFQADRDIELYFDETVKPGSSGNIIISNGSDTRTIAINDASQVKFDNSNRIVINPIADLLPNTNYSIKIDSGAITDIDDHPYTGISDDTTLNFSTIPTNPILIWSNPLDDSADFQIDHNIELNFNEWVKAGSSGNIVISNGSDTHTIAIDDTSQVTFDGYNNLIINPINDLIPNTNYNIKIDSDAITDLDGNPYVGISDDTTLNFTTTTSDPLLTGSNPSDDTANVPIDSNVVLYFNEPISSGAGNFVITNGTDTRVIAANDSNQVTFSGSKVTINPSADLVPNTTYHIEMGNGVITDLAGNPYAGISDETMLNFTTSDHAEPYSVDPTEPLFFDSTVPSVIGIADDPNLVTIS